MLTETLAVTAAGGALGVLLAVVSVPLAARLVPTALPLAEAPPADFRLIAVAVLATLVVTVACGVLPARRAARHTDAALLRDGGRAGPARRTERVRGWLVVAQVGASVALLVCAGLLLRALWRVQATDSGFDSEGVLTMRLNLPLPEYGPQAARVQFYRRVIEDIERVPGVAGAALTSFLPMTMRGGVWGVYLPGQPLDPGAAAQGALVRYITPRYFDVMGIPLRAGRRFDDRDALDAEQAAIVSETFGRRLWPGESSIGRRFVLMGTERTIVGIVGEVKIRGLERQSEPQLYLPHAQQPDNSFVSYTPRDLAVRAVPGASYGTWRIAARHRSVEIVAKADPRLPVSDVRPLSTILANETEARSVQARVLGGFAAISCVLAAVGLHGLLAFVVSSRTREIGVRVALGARRGDILAMIMVRGFRLAAIGALAGVGVAYLAARSVRPLLAGIDPADSMTIGAAVLLSLVMTLAGSLRPALTAARTDPMQATKAE